MSAKERCKTPQTLDIPADPAVLHVELGNRNPSSVTSRTDRHAFTASTELSTVWPGNAPSAAWRSPSAAALPGQMMQLPDAGVRDGCTRAQQHRLPLAEEPPTKEAGEGARGAERSLVMRRETLARAKAHVEAVIEASTRASRQREETQRRQEAKDAQRTARRAFTVTNVKTTPFPSSLKALGREGGFFFEEEDDDAGGAAGITGSQDGAVPPPPHSVSAGGDVSASSASAAAAVATPPRAGQRWTSARATRAKQRLMARPDRPLEAALAPWPRGDNSTLPAIPPFQGSPVHGARAMGSTSSRDNENEGGRGRDRRLARLGTAPATARRHFKTDAFRVVNQQIQNDSSRRRSGGDTSPLAAAAPLTRHRWQQHRGPAALSASMPDARALSLSRMSHASSPPPVCAAQFSPLLADSLGYGSASGASLPASQRQQDVDEVYHSTALTQPTAAFPVRRTASHPFIPGEVGEQRPSEGGLVSATNLPRLEYQRVADCMSAPVLQEVFNRYMNAIILSDQHLSPVAIDVATGQVLTSFDMTRHVLQQVLLFQFDRVDNQRVRASPCLPEDSLSDTAGPLVPPPREERRHANQPQQLRCNGLNVDMATQLSQAVPVNGCKRVTAAEGPTQPVLRRRFNSRSFNWDAVLSCLPQPAPLAVLAASPEARRRTEQRQWMELLRDVAGDGGAFPFSFPSVGDRSLLWRSTSPSSPLKVPQSRSDSDGFVDLYERLDGREQSCPAMCRTPIARHTAPPRQERRCGSCAPAPSVLPSAQRQTLLINAAWRAGLMLRWNVHNRHFPAPYYEHADNVLTDVGRPWASDAVGWEGPRLGAVARIRVNERVSCRGTRTNASATGSVTRHSPVSALLSVGGRVMGARSSSAQPISVVLQHHLDRRATRLHSQRVSSTLSEALAVRSTASTHAVGHAHDARSHRRATSGALSLASTLGAVPAQSEGTPDSLVIEEESCHAEAPAANALPRLPRRSPSHPSLPPSRAAAAVSSLPEMSLLAGALHSGKVAGGDTAPASPRGRATSPRSITVGRRGGEACGDGTEAAQSGQQTGRWGPCVMEGLSDGTPLVVEDFGGTCHVFCSPSTAPIPAALTQGWLQHRHGTRLPAVGLSEEGEGGSSSGCGEPKGAMAARPLALHITEAQLPWLAKQLTPEEGGLTQLREVYCSLDESEMQKREGLLTAWSWTKRTLAARANVLVWSVAPRVPAHASSPLTKTAIARGGGGAPTLEGEKGDTPAAEPAAAQAREGELCGDALSVGSSASTTASESSSLSSSLLLEPPAPLTRAQVGVSRSVSSAMEERKPVGSAVGSDKGVALSGEDHGASKVGPLSSFRTNTSCHSNSVPQLPIPVGEPTPHPLASTVGSRTPQPGHQRAQGLPQGRQQQHQHRSQAQASALLLSPSLATATTSTSTPLIPTDWTPHQPEGLFTVESAHVATASPATSEGVPTVGLPTVPRPTEKTMGAHREEETGMLRPSHAPPRTQRQRADDSHPPPSDQPHSCPHRQRARFSLRRDASVMDVLDSPALQIVDVRGVSLTVLKRLLPMRVLALPPRKEKRSDEQRTAAGDAEARLPVRRNLRDIYAVVGTRRCAHARSGSGLMAPLRSALAQPLELTLDGAVFPSVEILWLDAPRIRLVRLVEPLSTLRELHLLLDPTFLSSSLAGLEALPNLQVVHLEHVLLNELSFLGESASLRELLLHSCRVSIHNTHRASLSGVERAPSLEVLSLAYTLDIKDVTNFAACKTLRKLVLTRCNGISSASLVGLHTLPKLETLSLEYTRVSSITDFARCKSLTTLRLDGCKRILRTSIMGIEMSERLRELSLSGTNVITVANLGAGGSQIASLDLSDCMYLDVAGLQGIQGQLCLEILNLSRTPLTDLHFLADCPALMSLYVEDCDTLEPDAVDGLQDIPQLKRLVLDNCPTITQVGEFLQHCRCLQSLSLANCTKLSAASVAGLAKIRSLQYLDLTGCVGVTSVTALSHGCPRLRVLKLSGCEALTQETLRGLEELPELADLELNDLPRLVSVSFLAKAPALRRLSLTGCSGLSETGMAELLRTHIRLLL